MNPVLFDLGFVEVKVYSFLIFIAVIICALIIRRESKRFNYPKDFIFNLIFWVVIFGIIGARIYYVLFNYEYYAQNPAEILKIWNGGLAIHGGIIAGFITIVAYSKKYDTSFLKITDIMVVPLLLGQAIGRWGNFFNSEAHGAATTLATLKNLHIPDFIINGMYINGIYYQPSFLYESIWCLLGFIVLLFIRRTKYIKIGQLTSIYLMWYGFGRFFIEIGRTDSLMLFGFKAAQVISILLFIAGLVLFVLFRRKSKFEDLYNDNIQSINY